MAEGHDRELGGADDLEQGRRPEQLLGEAGESEVVLDLSADALDADGAQEGPHGQDSSGA